ncbi:pantoate--beta-alanine ligase [Parvicella tangerina]|uniref:Pantothenate synthetase n=1 Tax=Parvicella tangerina TaxID=2829795 RepID=A0A916JQP8_9FLAO|nr:pantoate--beta-alanine ligase [Parvicella tangerina]CAG5087079.1 Pantothenate synthetase [Parvicella tangerina]
MKVFTTQESLKEELKKHSGKTIGFVPTMGALHRGHTSLLTKAKTSCDVVVCSIFVNPTQFNDPKDYQSYPIQIEEDKKKLEEVGCDLLYLPNDVKDVYMNEKEFNVDLGVLDQVMEGRNRPGHFKGVMRVVKLLFEIVNPTHAFFGLKDYQQYLIVKKMVDELDMGIHIVGCETIREADGLAMSSRNLLLTFTQRQVATTLIKTLHYCKDHYTGSNIADLEKRSLAMMQQYGEPEYFVIRRADNLEEVPEGYTGEVRAFVVCRIGKVRLIDNLQIN